MNLSKLPDTVDNDTFQSEGIGECCQIQKTVEADALVNLSHLLEHSNQGDFTQSRQILLQRKKNQIKAGIVIITFGRTNSRSKRDSGVSAGLKQTKILDCY